MQKEQKTPVTDQYVIFRIRQKVPVQAGAGKIPGEEPDPGYQCPGINHFYFTRESMILISFLDPDPVIRNLIASWIWIRNSELWIRGNI
jgi:hypothetical protein